MGTGLREATPGRLNAPTGFLKALRPVLAGGVPQVGSVALAWLPLWQRQEQP
jgi:hypothetical protein